MNNTINGTSLKDLQMRQQRQYDVSPTNINNLQHMQYEQQPVSNGNMFNNPPMERQHNVKQILRSDQADIEDLARDIGNNLPADALMSVNSETEEQVENKKEQNNGILKSVPIILREPLILVVLFVILSQPVVKNFIGKYVKQINPDESGVVPLVGITIYGAILATLFVLSKKLLLK